LATINIRNKHEDLTTFLRKAKKQRAFDQGEEGEEINLIENFENVKIEME
jgi:hypothetical protein